MPRLRLHDLGGLAVSSSRRRSLPIARSCRSVLGYLITHRHRHVTRDELAETLWSDHGGHDARRCLSTALWRLKKTTEPDMPPLLSLCDRNDITLNWTATAWVDSVALERRIGPLLRVAPQALGHAQLIHLERAIALYRGDFLAGMDGDWAFVERERIRNLFFDGLYHLTLAYVAASDWNRAIECGRRLSSEEPLREDVHRLLMSAYASSGNRAMAIAQYRRCQRVLRTDLGVDPMEETEALFRQLAHSQEPIITAASPPARPNLANIRRQMVHAQRALASSRQQLDQAIESLAQTDLRQIGE